MHKIFEPYKDKIFQHDPATRKELYKRLEEKHIKAKGKKTNEETKNK